MQIVIDIPNKEYERLVYMDMFKLRGYIENGTLLPEGHGKLIDADNVKNHFSDREGDVFTAFHFYDVVENAPTIIEADKTRGEEKDGKKEM